MPMSQLMANNLVIYPYSSFSIIWFKDKGMGYLFGIERSKNRQQAYILERRMKFNSSLIELDVSKVLQ